MKQKKQKKQNIGTGIIFILLIAFVISISFVIKIFEVYAKSSFDGKNNFNITHLGSGGWEVVSISPINKSITILNVQTFDEKKFSNLRIPEDLRLESRIDVTPENVKHFLTPSLSSSSTNLFDRVKIVVFINSVPSKSISEETIDIKNERAYEAISEILSNETFLSEKLTMELVNSTGESGVGSNVARFITNLGGNVILVNTGSKVVDISRIYSQRKDSETVRKIQKLLAIDIDSSSQRMLSDVKIVIGKDLSERFR